MATSPASLAWKPWLPQPIAPYPVQKLAGELYMQSYWRVYGIETVCLRYFNVFGAAPGAGLALTRASSRSGCGRCSTARAKRASR